MDQGGMEPQLPMNTSSSFTPLCYHSFPPYLSSDPPSGFLVLSLIYHLFPVQAAGSFLAGSQTKIRDDKAFLPISPGKKAGGILRIKAELGHNQTAHQAFPLISSESEADSELEGSEVFAS